TAATIVPKVLIEELGDEGDIAVLDLVEPRVEKKIALVAARQTTKTVIVNALRAAVRDGF
ncbi:MAG: LysR family transcriptional regulator, partial [Pseudomonadota bacterium]